MKNGTKIKMCNKFIIVLIYYRLEKSRKIEKKFLFVFTLTKMLNVDQLQAQLEANIIRWKQKSIAYYQSLTDTEQAIVLATCYNNKAIALSFLVDCTKDELKLDIKSLKRVFPTISLQDSLPTILSYLNTLAIKMNHIINAAPPTVNMFVNVASSHDVQNEQKIFTRSQFIIGVCRHKSDEKSLILRIPTNYNALYLHKSMYGTNDGCVIIPMNQVFRKVSSSNLYDLEDINPYSFLDTYAFS